MLFKTHLAFSFFLGLLIIKFFKINSYILFLILLLFFSIFPDIDYYKSTIAKKLGIFRYIIKFFLKHRGFFHSIFLPLILFLFFVIINNQIIGFFVLIGYFSHLLLDSLTKSGIAFLYPINKFKIKGVIKSGGIFDYLMFLGFLIWDLYFLIVIL